VARSTYTEALEEMFRRPPMGASVVVDVD